MQGVKITAQTKKRFLEELEKCGGIVTVACKRTGISPKTYYRICTDGHDLYDEEFARESEIIREASAGAFAESALVFYLKKRNLKAAMFYLSSRNNKFTPKSKVEMSGHIAQTTDISPAAQIAAQAYAKALKQQFAGGTDAGKHSGLDNRKQTEKRKRKAD